MTQCGVSILVLWNFLKGKATAKGYTFSVTSGIEGSTWDGSWPAPSREEEEAAYYDLLDSDGQIVCMDGEECEVVYDPKNQLYRCRNGQGEDTCVFELTPEEFHGCTFR